MLLLIYSNIILRLISYCMSTTSSEPIIKGQPRDFVFSSRDKGRSRYTKCVSAIMTRVAIVAVVLLLYVAISASSVVRGPFPASVVVPVNSLVWFTCTLNTSLLMAGNFNEGPGWTTWPRATSAHTAISHIGDDLILTSLLVNATEIYLSGGTVQYSVTFRPTLEVLSANATILAYGKVYPCDINVPKFTQVILVR